MSAESDHGDSDMEFAQFLQSLREPVADELTALQSIYGESSVLPYSSGPGSANVRYQIIASLPPPNEHITLRVLVSLPASYPASSPPQLQLMSRYLGPFSVSPALFGAIIRTYMSSDGVEWAAGDVAVFDGMQKVIEQCDVWYSRRVELEKVAQAANARSGPSIVAAFDTPPSGDSAPTRMIPHLLSDLRLFEAEPIVDRKSIFVGRACRVSDPKQVPAIISHLMNDRRISRAAHPVINAWRCTLNGVSHQDNDDDGESAAGSRLAHLLQILELDNVLVIVTRYFGGIHLGPDRFKHINQAARNALDAGGFLEIDDVSRKMQGRGKKRV